MLHSANASAPAPMTETDRRALARTRRAREIARRDARRAKGRMRGGDWR